MFVDENLVPQTTAPASASVAWGKDFEEIVLRGFLYDFEGLFVFALLSVLKKGSPQYFITEKSIPIIFLTPTATKN